MNSELAISTAISKAQQAEIEQLKSQNNMLKQELCKKNDYSWR